MSSKNKLWFSFAENGAYKQQDQFFFDVRDTEWCKRIEDGWKDVKAELEILITDKEAAIVPYFNKTLASNPNDWNVFPFYMWGTKYHDNIKTCPKTCALLESIPGMVSASFSIINPQTTIKGHYGDTNAMYRCHLGLIIPASMPQCTMKVGNEEKSWIPGQVLAFCDAQYHTAWNKTDQKRYVLIFDVIRPEFLDKTINICAKVQGNLFWQTAFQKFYIFDRFPRFLRQWIMKLSQWPFYYKLKRNKHNSLITYQV